MKTVTRSLCAIAFPLGYVLLMVVAGGYGRLHPASRTAVGLGDLSVMLLPSVVIFLIALALLRRSLGAFAPVELVAFSLGSASASVVGIAAGTIVVYGAGNSYLADVLFFSVIPFAPPILGVFGAYRASVAWHRRRVGPLVVQPR